MKEIIILLASVVLLGGCASTETIKRLETQSGHGAFQVINNDAAQPPAGFGDVQIILNLKTREKGSVLIERTSYGTDHYQLLIGIAGQTEWVTGEMTYETGDYRGSTDPEAGNGVRYRFATTLRLPVGNHQITFVLPEDSVVFEQNVNIRQGSNQLLLKPIYRLKSRNQRYGFRGERTFYDGVKALMVSDRNC